MTSSFRLETRNPSFASSPIATPIIALAFTPENTRSSAVPVIAAVEPPRREPNSSIKTI